jgi:hypothetical protein
MPCHTQQSTTLTLLRMDCLILQCRVILTTPFLLQVPAGVERYHAALLPTDFTVLLICFAEPLLQRLDFESSSRDILYD